MSYATVKSKIDALRAKTAANSITPESLGAILQDILDVQSSTSQKKEEFVFANIQGLTVDGSVETELYVSSDKEYHNNTELLLFGNKDNGEPIFKTLKDCRVEITGQINMQPVNSATTDRVLHWYTLDEDGERVSDNVITTHFTGTTQIFNIPINHMVRLNQGEFLYLVAYTSGSSQTLISDNSHINVTITPM